MLKIDVIAVGRIRKGPLFELSEEYCRRITWPLTIHEVESKHSASASTQTDEEQKILKYIKDNAFVIVMDERGAGLKSLDFAETIGKLRDSGEPYLQFVIGGADGLTDAVRDRANLLLSFGQQTWPHLLARVMLLEQIYRGQQILSGHPYHRE